MNDTHKVCRRCEQELPIDSFKEVYKTNGSGESKLYRNSYCQPCEIARQKEYTIKHRKRREGVLPLEEYLANLAKAKQERLEKVAKEKAERKKQREIAKQEKAKQRELDRQKRLEEGQAKWEAWYKSYVESGAMDAMKEKHRAEAEAKRKEMLESGIKTCTMCGIEKPISQYHTRTRKRSDGSRYKIPYAHCKECRRATNRKHEHTPEGKARKKRNNALRDRRNRQATPKWLTKEQKQQIVNIYEHMRDCRATTGEDYHVDHIIPLRGENICGLHVPWNLQVLPADVNVSKSNEIDTVHELLQ